MGNWGLGKPHPVLAFITTQVQNITRNVSNPVVYLTSAAQTTQHQMNNNRTDEISSILKFHPTDCSISQQERVAAKNLRMFKESQMVA
jgi:hypothetical protein